MADLFGNNKGAEFSPCRKYRYKLWRLWDESKPIAMCIGLNPSNAAENKNDPTIANLRKMLAQLGYGGFYMTNLFAIVSSKPEILPTCEDPQGDNEIKLRETAAVCQDVIFCWGLPKWSTARAKEIIPQYPNALCFGVTEKGTPFHPLAITPRNGRDPLKTQLFKYSDLCQIPT